MGAFDLELAIQRIVQRWVGPPLALALVGCQGPHQAAADHDRGGLAGAGTDGAAGAAGGAGIADIIEPPPDALDTFQPDLVAAGSGFLAPQCDAAGRWDPMPYVAPAQAFDYRALRRRLTVPEGVAPYLSDEGNACVGSSNLDACMSAMDAVPLAEAGDCVFGRCSAITTTQGDLVQQWVTVPDLLAFLGAIDTPEEALLRAQWEGYTPGHAVDHSLFCTTAAVRAVGDGFEVYARSYPPNRSACGGPVYSRQLLRISAQGALQVVRSVDSLAQVPSCPGRRPEGLHAQAVEATNELGTFYARCAQLEAAAVHAFARMAGELRQHGAPSELVDEALRASDDEERHARQMKVLAEHHAVAVPPIRVARPEARPRLAMALENAVEGCANEAWAAVVATHQAFCARDPIAAATFARIARDERRHAALSLRVGAWLHARLEHDERVMVGRAYMRAIAALRARVQRPLSPRLMSEAGLPGPHVATFLFEALRRTLSQEARVQHG